MGNVYLSFTRGGRPIAVKVIRREFADDPEFRRRFRQEVAAAQRVQGVYTAPVLDADPEAPVPWLATAYIAGPSLAQAVAEHGAFPMLSVCRLLGGVAEGLASVHAAGLVHRDLKPANVLLAEDGPRVIDFGIAHAADASTLTGTGAIVGTPAFMAPEQVNGEPVSPATDVFALGHLVAYAATGHAAFGEGQHAALVFRIATREPNLDGCPDPLRPFLARCLAKDPAARPAIGEAMEFARQAISGHTVGLVGASWLPDQVASNLTAYDSAVALRAPAPQPAAPSGQSTARTTVPAGGSAPVSAPGQPHPSLPSVPGTIPAATASRGGAYPQPGQGHPPTGYPERPGYPPPGGLGQQGRSPGAASPLPGPWAAPLPGGPARPGLSDPDVRRRRLTIGVFVLAGALVLLGTGAAIGASLASGPTTSTGTGPGATSQVSTRPPASHPAATSAPAAQPSGSTTTAPGTAPTSSSSTTYSTTEPFPLCDSSGAQWILVNMTPGSCGQSMQPSVNSGGYGFDTVSAFPHGIPLSAGNTATVTGQLGNPVEELCLGTAEGNGSSGYVALLCSNGQWYINSVVGLGTSGATVGRQVATGSYPFDSSTTYVISLTFGNGAGKLSVNISQGTGSPITQSFSTGQFTPTAVGLALNNNYSGDSPSIGGFTYMAS